MTFEDIFLNFPDRTSDDQHLSNLEERDKSYQGLKSVSRRIFVTAGHMHVDWHNENETYLNSLQTQSIKTVYKPSGGIHNILEKAELLDDYWWRRRSEWRAAQPSSETGDSESGGHSAPGLLLFYFSSALSVALMRYYVGLKLFKTVYMVQPSRLRHKSYSRIARQRHRWKRSPCVIN